MIRASAARAGFALYRLVGRLGVPLVRRHLARRCARGREDATRLDERFGLASVARPEGPLLWLHAASVGESLSVLPLLERIRAGWPTLAVLMTSCTVTSARLLVERLPPEVIHQYSPVDLPAAARRFLAHWRPSLGLLVESELWPNLLLTARQQGCVLLLINGRMSAASAKAWRRFPPAIRLLLAQFAEIFARSPEDLAHFQALGAERARCLGNLKFAGPPLGCDADELARFTALWRGRPLWLAASTHPGEEAIAGAVQQALRSRFRGLLTVIAPRHPDRGPVIAEELAASGLKAALRSRGETPGAEADVYIADSIGELGLWYRLAPVVFVGGSLVPKGGQNPIEPARLGRAVLFGPHCSNFVRVCQEMTAAGVLQRVADRHALAEAGAGLLADESERQHRGEAARRYAEAEAGVLDAVVMALAPYLDRLTGEGATK
ncbi:MAG: 3-deoxy-D-manno-octulosonic acid transferase [Kiloniellales bacterium]